MRQGMDRRSALSCATKWIAVAMAFVVIGGIGGCTKAPPTGSVSGKVTLRGKPFKDAFVAFSSEPGRIVGNGQLNASGEFRFEKPIPQREAEYIVFILPPPGLAEMGKEVETERFYKSISSQYLTDGQSKLRAKVDKVENTFTFDLK